MRAWVWVVVGEGEGDVCGGESLSVVQPGRSEVLQRTDLRRFVYDMKFQF